MSNSARSVGQPGPGTICGREWDAMDDTEELSCRELVELVSDYLEGALEPRQLARFEAHLSICEGCRTYLEQMRTTIALAGSLTEESLPPPARDRLLVAFKDWKRARLE